MITWDAVLIILGAICIIIGFIGCIVPVLPGTSLCYVAIILLHLTSYVEFSIQFLILWAFIVIAVHLLDYYIPIWGTKKLGGGKKGAWGSAIGIVFGMFILPPWGILLFPFVGAVVGELIDNKELNVALKAGLGAFAGFIAGTVIKLVVAGFLAFYFFREVYSIVL